MPDDTALPSAIRSLPLAQLHPSPTNPRRRFDASGLDELAASLRTEGVLVPLLVRPRHDAAGYEIVAGERRYRAAQIAGFAEVPCLVRPLTDSQVLRAQITENLQRADITPLEEALSYERLMALDTLPAEAVAGIIGKSEAYVYARLKLLGLHAESRAALEDGRLDFSRALIVARIADPKHQAEALEVAVTRAYGDDTAFRYSVRELQEQFARKRRFVPLAEARFALDDAALVPDAGACTACPHRDTLAGGNRRSRDPEPCCVRPRCFDAKQRLQDRRRAEDAHKSGRPFHTGPAAEKIGRGGAGQLAGYIDLDARVERETFPESEPDIVEDDDERVADEANEAAYQAWSDRADAWARRTYRALIGERVEDVVEYLQHPKDKRIVEIVPIEAARQACSILKIDLPSWIGRKPPEQTRHDPETWKREQAEREAREAKERAYRARLFAAVFAKAIGPLTDADVRPLVAKQIGGLDWEIRKNAQHPLRVAYDGKRPNPAALKGDALARLVRMLPAVHECGRHVGGKPSALLALAHRYKIDPAQYRADPEAKPAAQKAPPASEKKKAPAKDKAKRKGKRG